MVSKAPYLLEFEFFCFHSLELLFAPLLLRTDLHHLVGLAYKNELKLYVCVRSYLSPLKPGVSS